jgi:hypothetical protein
MIGAIAHKKPYASYGVRFVDDETRRWRAEGGKVGSGWRASRASRVRGR